jgi:hypothetical protein
VPIPRSHGFSPIIQRPHPPYCDARPFIQSLIALHHSTLAWLVAAQAVQAARIWASDPHIIEPIVVLLTGLAIHAAIDEHQPEGTCDACGEVPIHL